MRVTIDIPRNGVPPYVICEQDCSEWYRRKSGRIACEDWEVDSITSRFQWPDPIDPGHRPPISRNVTYRRDVSRNEGYLWVKNTFVIHCNERMRYQQWSLNTGFLQPIQSIEQLRRQSELGHSYATESLLALAGF